MPRIEIGLATYNSAKFLRAQLDSLFSQTCQDFDLLVADDGSSDATLAILAEYKARFPHRIRLLAFDTPAGGACANFARITDAFTADYAMYCDHDDVWLPDKIEVSLARMREIERQHGDVCAFVHSDVAVCDGDLNVVANSVWEFANRSPERSELEQQLLTNVAIGCTMLMNRALYRAARPIPRDAAMHDHWVSLVGAAFGVLAAIDRPTVLYRRHGDNATSLRSWSLLSSVVRFAKIVSGRHLWPMRDLIGQARAFQRAYGDRASKWRDSISALADIENRPRYARFAGLAAHGVLLQGAQRNIGLFLATFMLPKKHHIETGDGRALQPSSSSSGPS